MFKQLSIIFLLTASIWAKPNNPRIIGGSPAEQGQFPFIVSLQPPSHAYNNCGASIIDERHLLTAGHCLYESSANNVVVFAGSATLDGDGTYYSVSKLAVHPNYNPQTLVNDVGVVTLRDPIQLNENVQRINLPTDITPNVGDEATAIGWGTLSYPNLDYPNQLRFLTRKILDNQECQKALNSNIGEGQVCFGGDNGHGLCFGDSGSPLVYTANNKNYVIGVVSWGNPCGIGYPDVYTRIAPYLPWIQDQLSS